MRNAEQTLHPLIDHYMNISRHDKAAELIRQALADDPLNDRLHYQAAVACYHLDQYPKARKHLQQAYQSGFPPVQVHHLEGMMYADEEQWSLAEDHYLAALHTHPHAASVLASYASLLIRLGHREQGLEMLAEARRIDPGNIQVIKHSLYYEVARNLEQKQMINLEQLVKHENNKSALSVELGIKEYYSGNYKLAKKHFREAYISNPTNSQLLKNVQIVERKTNIFLLPHHLSERIGGLPFLWFWITAILLTAYPFASTAIRWPLYAVGGLIAYLFTANYAVRIYYNAKDTNTSFFKQLFSLTSLLVLAVLLAGIFLSLFMLNPLFAIAGFFGARYFSKKTSK
ncbi:tetratricopeptide repeat protein [Paenibacillus sp. MMS18-CY102]|uniref:tetratricopeptide repeat protein n=1 Tax=Paenibacillus sp. MMS18-CY102 TaxID=2682849 RepID=UPI001365D19D|nr:tetratricopeptide repeat protein [Paenibacillus sp. MMS18-CY102]MWC29292.1 tetratricopeptide repeat protein [Paenibacillus sp. MMS18-CY102]